MDQHQEPGEQAQPGPGPVVSRRGVLIAAAAVVVGAGTGVAAAVLRPQPITLGAPAPPAPLADALAAERALLAGLATASVTLPAQRELIAQLSADHRAHEQALVATLVDYPGASAAPSPSPANPADPSPSVPALKAAELQAAAAAASRARALRGSDATLLASISACEASHAALLG